MLRRGEEIPFSLAAFQPLLNSFRAPHESDPAPHESASPSHQITRSPHRHRSAHQSLRRPGARSRLGALFRGWPVGSMASALPPFILSRAASLPDLRSVTLSVPGDAAAFPAHTFPFPMHHDDAAEWFSMFFEQQILVRYSPAVFPTTLSPTAPPSSPPLRSKPFANGSPASPLDEVACAFRTALEIDGVPAFLGRPASSVKTNTASSASKSAKSISRAAIPGRRALFPRGDPFTGISLDGFQKRFTQQRESTLPSWSPRARFDALLSLRHQHPRPLLESTKLRRQGDLVRM